MSQEQTSTIYVADLPVSKDSNGQPVSQIDEEFLRLLFQDCGVDQSSDAVTIKTKITRDGKPCASALVRFENHECAMKAIAELNYTKLDNVPIRLFLVDEETKAINFNQGILFIKNLDPDIEVSQLHDAFANFGEIISCEIPSDIQIITKPDGTKEKKLISREYGYVQFRNPEDAKQAMTDLKDASINGRPVEVLPFCPRQQQNTETTFVNCFIQNIPESYTDEDLKNLFSEFGTPESYKVVTDENGKSKQFGFCSMSSHEEAVKAVEGLNGREIDGSTITCGRSKTKNERQKEIQIESEKWRKANYEKYKGRCLYVRNFDETVTDEELKMIFSQFGNVESAKVILDDEGNSKQFGFVCFETEFQAEKCLKESPLLQIHGKQSYVSIAMSKDQRLKLNLAKAQQIVRQQPGSIQFQPEGGMPMGFPAGIPQFGYPQPQLYQQDTKSMLRSQIMEKHPQNTILLQRLDDMSEEQAKELATNQSLFFKWMEQP